MTRSPAAVRQTIILAAGAGTRLSSANGVPKPLVMVGGVPLVSHALLHAAACGCREAIIVIGHEGARVRAAVEATQPAIAVRFVENPDPTTPNGESLLVAASSADETFFLQMVDHLFAEPVLTRLVSTPLDDQTVGRVLADRAPVNLDLSDATRVRLLGDRVTAIGKNLEPWDAIDAGCFVLTPAVFDALRAVSSREARTVSSAMRRLVERRALAVEEIRGIRWIDVDTPADLAEAERLVGASTPGIAREAWRR